MAEERPKVKSLKLKKESGGSELLKSAVKRPSSEGKGTPERREQVNSFAKGKEVRSPGSTKDFVRSNSFGKNLVRVGKEIAKSDEGKVASKEGRVAVKPEQRPSEAKSPSKVSSKITPKAGTPVKDMVKSPIKKEGRVPVRDEGKLPIKKEGRLLLKDEVKSPMKVSSKEGKVLTKEKGNANGKEQEKSVNGKERAISIGKEFGKTNGKSLKMKGEDRDVYREKEKGKGPIAKSPLAKTPVKPESASKSIVKTGASPAGGQSVRKQIMKTTTTTMTASKTVTEQKKEKKVFELPGQKHDPPEERDALRIFYTTLREQMPESDMAEIWLMEYGLLPPDEAQKAFQRKQKRTQSSKQGGPASKVSTPPRLSNGSIAVKKSTPVINGKGNKAVVSAKPKAKKKRDNSDSDSDDFLQNVMSKKKKKLKT